MQKEREVVEGGTDNPVRISRSDLQKKKKSKECFLKFLLYVNLNMFV